MWSEIEAEELSEHSPNRNPFCSSLFRPGSQGALLTAWRSSIDCRSCRQFHRLRQTRSEEHTSELQSLAYLVCRLLLEKKKRPGRKVSLEPTKGWADQ